MSGLSALFSLSDAAARVPPIPVSTAESVKVPKDSKDMSSGKNGSYALKHRRLSSTGQTRRRMNDARDAVSRPAPANLSAASALASLSSLSLTPSGITSSISSGHNLHSHSHHARGRSNASIAQPIFAPNPNGASGMGALASSVPETSYAQDMASTVADDIEVDVEDFDDGASVAESVGGRSIDKRISKNARVKKRGTIFQCESCSKVYRHPSCLVKHRWEHSPHWREASKFMLSKHQQVQLLEAATILSHLTPGSSLPDDRSHWPSFLSNGLLPPPSVENTAAMNPQMTTVSARSGTKSTPSSLNGAHHLVSSSVPARAQAPHLDRNRSTSVTSTASGAAGGPRLHDFSVPNGITQIRPGLLAHATAPGAPSQVLSGSVLPYADEELDIKEEKDALPSLVSMEVVSPSKPQPMSVPVTVNTRNNFEAYRDGGSAFSASGFSVESGSVAVSLAHSGGWSLPHSDLRSSSVTRSFSGSRSDDDEDGPHSTRDGSEGDVDVDISVADTQTDRLDGDASFGEYASAGFGYASRTSTGTGALVKKETDDGWEEMDMEL